MEDIVKDGIRLVPRKHSTPRQMEKGGLLDDIIKAYYKIVGIRNPFSFHLAKYLRNRTRRLKQIDNKNSWINKLPEKDKLRYVNTIRKQANMSFEQYLRDMFAKYKLPKSVQEEMHTEIDFFIHQESINDDLACLCQKLKIEPRVEAGLVNITNAIPEDKTYRDYYTDELIELVYKWNKPSFERFPEYDFDGFHPDRCAPG